MNHFMGKGSLRLTIHDMPYVVCAQGHKRFVSIGFAAQLLDLIRSPDIFQSIPGATKKGLFKKSYHCPKCSRELPESPTGHQTQEVTAELVKAQPFKVAVRVPVYKCGECGKECLRSVEETATLAFKATDHAYRSIDIHPN